MTCSEESCREEKAYTHRGVASDHPRPFESQECSMRTQMCDVEDRSYRQQWKERSDGGVGGKESWHEQRCSHGYPESQSARHENREPGATTEVRTRLGMALLGDKGITAR